MARREEGAKRLAARCAPPWEQLPDLGLYMDQVITFLERHYEGRGGGKQRMITPAMVNNYVKSGLVVRPVGKKYGREQIAQLMMLCALKQAMSLEDLKGVIGHPVEGSVAALYETFRGLQQSANEAVAREWDALTALECAMKAATYQHLCAEILSPAENE